MTAILAITDGTTRIDLLNPANSTGFNLKDWKPKIADYKSDGVFQDSSLSEGRRLVYGVYGNVTETVKVAVNGFTPDDVVWYMQELRRLLKKADDYWLTDWQDEPVWIEAVSKDETNMRYGLVAQATAPNDDFPYGTNFASVSPSFDEVTVTIERAPGWLGNAPGTGTCVEVSSTQEWGYDTKWTVNTTSPVDYVYSFLQTTTGRILAGELGQIWYSDNNGTTWNVLTTSPVDRVYSFLQTTTGRILAGELGQIWYSDNNGTTWNVLTTSPVSYVFSLLQMASGRILAGEAGQIWYSDDNGATWVGTGIFTGGPINGLVQLSNGTILAGSTEIYSSTNGVTWSILSSAFYMSYCLKVVGSSRILSGDSSNIRYSDDNGETWSNAFIVGGSPTSFYSLLLLTDGTILAGNQDSDIFISTDNGETWVRYTTAPVGEVRSLIQTSSGTILAGENGQIWKLTNDVLTFGVEDTCLNSPYIINQSRYANITHIFIDDGGVFGANLLPMTVFPVQLYPVSPALNDAIYFISDTLTFNSGLFDNLIFDLSNNINYTTSYTITWEYYNGATWATLSVQDGTNSFKFKGVNSVHWRRPSDWATTTINGIAGYIVRARISALSGTITTPSQQNRNVYSIVNSYIDLASVGGDIPANTQIKLYNRSDNDGPAGNAPNLYSNRVVIGLKSKVNNFQSFINLSDNQWVPGINVEPSGTFSSFIDSALTPTRRMIAYTGAGSMDTRAIITLSPSVARDFYGTYHAFLRGQRSADPSTDITVRLQIATGSGGITFTSQGRQFQTTTTFEVLDFGQINIPVSGVFKSSELGDKTEIRIQASIISGTPNLYMYDLILIPVDEWAIDAVDRANESDSDVGRSNSISKLLDIDSITFPKEDLRALVRTVDASEFITAQYLPIANGPAMLQANADQRLWFFAMQTSATGSSYSWIAPPEICHSVQVFANPRYLSLRGNR